MVLEVALFDVSAGSEDDFRAGYGKARVALAASPGLRSIRMTQGIETPSRFVLLVEWDSVAAHQAFRDSDRYPAWRAEISPYFADQPRVEHFSDVE